MLTDEIRSGDNNRRVFIAVAMTGGIMIIVAWQAEIYGEVDNE